MNNYYKYLPISEEDEKWGLHVLNAGFSRIDAGQLYPPQDHPSHHYFSWDKGRTFDEYQLIYISNGEGLFESKRGGLKKITEGTIIFLFPGEWHRFKPDTSSGWDEHWVGFKGQVIANFIEHLFFHPSDPVLHTGVQDSIVKLFTEIIEETKLEKPYYQPSISGAVIHLLGLIYSKLKQSAFKPENFASIVVNKARVILRNHADQDISLEKIAEEFKVSYSWFRKAFKDYTGIAPGQYLLQLKIDKAKTLLSEQSHSIKEIAYKLNFESAFYFSKLFKEKTGLSPEHFRKKIQHSTDMLITNPEL